MVIYNATHSANPLWNSIHGVSFMPTPNHVNASPGDVLILAGTMKGAFVLRADKGASNGK